MRLLVWLGWTAFAVSAPFVLYAAYRVGEFVYVFGPDLIKPCEIAHGNFAENGRGDSVEYQVRDCSIIGSASEERVGLRLADTEGFAALVYYDQGPKPREVVLHWFDDDHLSVDLGEVNWLTPQIGHLGRVTISYTYSGAEPSLE
ncbi:MAG: hypothetical protein ACREDM_04290 [Methylocella sp.]